MATNSIRFTGLASGLDTESMVESMVLPYKMKVDTKWQEKALMEMQKDAWRDMNSQLLSFYDKYVGQMRLESTFNKKSVSVSNTSAITIDKNSALPIGTHTIDKISQLAEGARLQSKPIEANKTTKLTDLGIKEGEKITLNQKEITITKDETIGSLMKKMQEVAPDLSINFDDKAKAFFISSKKTGASQSINLGVSEVWNKLGINTDDSSMSSAVFLKIQVEQKEVGENQVEVLKDNLTLSIDGVEVNFAAGEEIAEMIKKLEKRLDGSTPKVDIQYKEGIISFLGANDKLIDPVSGSVEKSTGAINIGKNALVSYNGVAVESETNTISVNGLNFTINAKTNEVITLVSSQDAESVVSFVKEFVDAYNKLIEDIHGKLNATSSKGYAPLTDDQKKEMSEYEIEAWEKKIKDGIFRGNSDLRQITNTMRQILSGSVEGGTFTSLAQIGISTKGWQENGKLYFDEDKFKAAIAEDSESVIQLLAGSGDPKALYEKNQKEGTVTNTKSWEELMKSTEQVDKDLVSQYKNRTNSIGDKLYDKITENTCSNTLRSAYSFYNDKILESKITNAKDEISKLQERMYSMEDLYYKKFTAMEKMMQQLNSQSSWLTSQ